MVQPPPPSSTMDTPRTCHLHLHPHSSIRSPIHLSRPRRATLLAHGFIHGSTHQPHAFWHRHHHFQDL